jgi:DNA invertase Pin-like site-specific DNA recombinase
MRVKYIRVSSEGQNISRQDDKGLFCYVDVCSGSVAFKDREEGHILMHMAEKVTEIVVHSIDRLGRNTIDIMQTIQYFTNKGVNIISEKEGLQTIVNGKENPVAKMMIGILGTLAEFELTRIKERQAEGIAKAKARGEYVGRAKGTTEDITTFTNKKGTQAILRYLRQGYSINKTALLSETSTGSVKKVKKMIKEGLIVL